MRRLERLNVKKIFAVLLAALMVLSLAACGASSAKNESMAGDMAMPEAPYGNYQSAPMEAPEAEEAGWDGGAMGGEAKTALNGAKLIYRATLELQTLEFEKATEDIARLAGQLGGYFEEKSLSTYSSNYRHADYVVRVPAEKFDSFCAQVGELCHVTYSTSSAEDISESYYDTKARLDTAQIKLERLQKLLGEAKDMADIITIESAISETEYEIDYLSGTLRSYDSLVNYSTVYLSLSEVYRLSNTEEAPKTFGEKLSNAFTEGLEEAGELLEDIVIWLAYNWLLVIIWLVIIALVIALLRRLRKGVKLPKLPKLRRKNKEIPAQTKEAPKGDEAQ